MAAAKKPTKNPPKKTAGGEQQWKDPNWIDPNTLRDYPPKKDLKHYDQNLKRKKGPK